MQKRYFKIPIKVKPYVKRYIEYNYGEAISISLKNPLSMVLYAFLQKSEVGIIKESVINKEKKLSELKSTLYLVFPIRERYRNGIFINEDNQIIINNVLEDIIKRDIFMYVANIDDSNRKLKGEKIEEFCEKNNLRIDEDFTLEAILKAEYRYRSGKKSLQKNLPILS